MDVDLTVTERHRPLGVAAAAAAAFAILAVLVSQRAPGLAGLDSSWHASAHAYGLAHPAWLAATRAVTHAGDTVTVLVVDLACLALCLGQRRHRAALFVVLAGPGTWLLRLALRELVGRPRPTDAFWPAEGLSFPSGHTANSAAMAAIAVVACWPYLNRIGRNVVLTVGALVPVLVGVSRVAGGVHWPTDVLGSLLLAAAVVAAAVGIADPLRPPRG